METHISAAPFGRRSMTLGMVATQMRARRCPDGDRVGKWAIFRAICEGKAAFGLGDRALAVLNALLSFLPSEDLAGDADLVVFPSNRQLALRAHGMAPATLRRHLAVLVEAGLLLRRDSPNGKRYARKDDDGAIEQAFGFDLRPILARRGDIEAAAADAIKVRRDHRAARESVTILRREIVKSIEAGEAAGIAEDWMDLRNRYAAILAGLPRQPALADCRNAAEALAQLAAKARKPLEERVIVDLPSAKESQTERHIQDSNPDTRTDLEPRSEEMRGSAAEHGGDGQRPPERFYPLGMVLQACPDILDYARTGIGTWADLVAVARLVRPMLAISADAWEDAARVMGDAQAAVVLAAILQRGDAIQSAGGYLRSLTRKAQTGEFSLGPVLMALLSKRRRAEEARLSA